MDILFGLTWRVYPATVLMGLGAAMVLWSLRGLRRRLAAAPRDPQRAFVIMRAFRTGMIGACLAGLGAGWCWQLPVLIGLSAIILFEETLESSAVIGALAHDLRGRCKESVPAR